MIHYHHRRQQRHHQHRRRRRRCRRRCQIINITMSSLQSTNVIACTGLI